MSNSYKFYSDTKDIMKKYVSWQLVLYALKDFLIKRLGSLLEHTT